VVVVVVDAVVIVIVVVFAVTEAGSTAAEDDLLLLLLLAELLLLLLSLVTTMRKGDVGNSDREGDGVREGNKKNSMLLPPLLLPAFNLSNPIVAPRPPMPAAAACA
jgi:hypothetical protein